MRPRRQRQSSSGGSSGSSSRHRFQEPSRRRQLQAAPGHRRLQQEHARRRRRRQAPVGPAGGSLRRKLRRARPWLSAERRRRSAGCSGPRLQISTIPWSPRSRLGRRHCCPSSSCCWLATGEKRCRQAGGRAGCGLGGVLAGGSCPGCGWQASGQFCTPMALLLQARSCSAVAWDAVCAVSFRQCSCKDGAALGQHTSTHGSKCLCRPLC